MKKLFSIIALSLAVGITGCKKDFLSSLEINPNAPSQATPQLLLSGALKVTADIINTGTSAAQSGAATYGVWMGYWTPSGSYVPNSTLNTYNFTNTSYQTFTPLFSNATNYNNLENVTADASLANFRAIAKIMKAYDFQLLVDTYNNVPYTEAFKAPEILFPKYDKGEAIYDDLLVQLTAAISLINASTGAVNPGSSDIAFKGVMTSWAKFANTLKLRIVLRQWNKFPAKQAALKASIAATAAAGYLDETIQLAVNPGYLNDDANGGKQSPFVLSYGLTAAGVQTTNGDYYKANSYAIAKLTATNDPRIGRFYTLPPSGGAFKGNIFGATNASTNANTSGIGPGLLKGPTQDAILLSSAEALFLQAEGSLPGYGLVSGVSRTFYEKGITASFVATVVPSAVAAATTYYTQANLKNVNWDASPDKLEAIINQKWTALNGYGNFEAYNEYRRTGFPVDVPASTISLKPGQIPTRIFYPSTELSQNKDNVLAEGEINQFTSKIFWAK